MPHWTGWGVEVSPRRGVELFIMQTVQLAIADPMYAASLREALSRTCAWRVETVTQPDLTQPCVMVLDQAALQRTPRPLANPERIVLVTHGENELMAEAWETGIVSVVSELEPLSTVLLAIMAAGLRVEKPHGSLTPSGISPTVATPRAPLPPEHRHSGPKRCKTQ